MLLCCLNSVILFTVFLKEYNSEQTVSNNISITLNMYHLDMKLTESDNSMFINAVVQTKLKKMN